MTATSRLKSLGEASGLYRGLLRSRPFSGVAVFAYHGVFRASDAGPAPPAFHVTADRFDEQCRVLRQCCTPISLEQFADAVTHGAPLPPAAALVTLDDGYRNALTVALPILERWNIPATMFVCPGPIEGGTCLWFDGLHDAHGEQRVGAVRRATYSEWRNAVARYAIRVARDHRNAVLSVAELQELARHPLITVGAHSMNHPALGRMPLEVQRSEVAQSRARLAEWLGTPPRWFAYPFGEGGSDFTDETESCVREAGFDDAFATGEAFTMPAAMRWRQRRFTMLQSVTAGEFAHRLAISAPRLSV